MPLVPALLLSLALCLPITAYSKGGHGGSSHASGSHSGGHSSHASRTHTGSASHSSTGSSKAHTGTSRIASTSKAVAGVQRDKHGRIKRSSVAKHEFQKRHPCPSTGKASGSCPGYVIDHVKPLKRGGADSPSNMQWQTKQAAKEKDKTE